MSDISSDPEIGVLKYDLVKETGKFSEEFQIFEEFYSDFQNYAECKLLLEDHTDFQSSFFCALEEADHGRLRKYLKKNGFPQTLGDLKLFIEKFGSLTADQDRVESETESQLNEVTKEHEEIESDYFNFFMEHCTKKYKGIIEKYESNHGRIVRENFNDFLRKSYYEMLEVNIAKDISFGAMVTTEDGGLSVVDFQASETVQLYTKLKELDVITMSGYEFLESSSIALSLQSEARDSDNSISGKDISHVGVGLIIEGASCPILQVKGDEVRYGDQLIDASEHPPVKFITSPSKSDYKLQSCELDFDRDVKLVYEKEQLLTTIKRNSEYLQGVNVNVESFQQKKAYIENADLSDECVLDFLLKTYSTNKNIRNLIEDLDEGGAVEMKQQALKKGILDFIASTVEKIMIVKNDLEVQNKEARKRLQDIKKNEERSIANYQRILKEKDDKLRSDLQLLDALGFTLIEQSFTDRLINEINHVEGFKGAIDLGGGFSISEDINLAEGEFGNCKGQNRREVLVRWINKAISGNPDEPNSIKGFVSGGVKSVGNKTKFMEDLKCKYHIQSASGAFDIEQVRENLKKPLEA